MEDHNHHHRVHPVVGTNTPSSAWPITSPLIPPGSEVSDKGSPLHSPALSQRNLDSVGTELPESRKQRRCCRCLCWTFAIICLLIVAAGIASGILYLVFQPKLPKYSIKNLRIINLRLNTDMTMYARFRVNITARNLNEKIGIYYKRGGQLSVWYKAEKLCVGSLPSFYQGNENITRLTVDMVGRTKSRSTLTAALREQQSTGQIPMDLRVQAPVVIKFGRLKLKEVRILGECSLLVDRLRSNKSVSIKASNCGYKLSL